MLVCDMCGVVMQNGALKVSLWSAWVDTHQRPPQVWDDEPANLVCEPCSKKLADLIKRQMRVCEDGTRMLPMSKVAATWKEGTQERNSDQKIES